MNGNSGNHDSRIQNTRQTQYGPTVRTFNFHLVDLHVFSNNNNALNRTIKRNSTKMVFAIALILLIVQFGGAKKSEIKIKRK